MLSKRAWSITPSPTMAIDASVKEMMHSGINVIGFAAGEPDFDTPLHIAEAGINAIREGHTRYTAAAGSYELKKAICAKFQADCGLEYNPSQIVVSNGAKHSLYNVFAALLNAEDEVIIPSPYWVSFPEIVKLNNGFPVILHCNREASFKVTLTDLKEAWTPRAKALVLNSPSNPTGQVYTRKELEFIADFACEHDLYVIADEIYEKLIYDGAKHLSIAALGAQIKNRTVVIKGVSKSYAMTGWRIGYTASTEKIAAAIGAIQSHSTSNPNTIAQKAALAALEGPQECVEEMRQAFDARRRYMYNRLSGITGFSPLKPLGAFYMFIGIENLLGKRWDGITIENSDDFATLLLKSSQVAVVPGTGFGAPDCIRLSYATSLENIREGLDRIEAFIESLT